jgi:hypothetical protein
MKKITLSLLALLLYGFAHSQGCIPVRNLVGFGQFIRPGYDSLNGTPTKWLLNVGTRYYEAYQTYQGSEKIEEAPQDRRVNKVFIANFSISRMFDNGWSYTVDVPITTSSRRAWQEHHVDASDITSNSFGLGDIRITGYKWLFDVNESHRGNIQLGVGIKLPTGDYRYEDFFHKATGTISAPVNPTIQLGDGGTGFTVELNSFYIISRRVSLYGNLFYLFNPRDQNGVSNMNGSAPPNSDWVEFGATINSVPDAFTARLGGNFSNKNVVLWGGFRMEGQPVHDVIGGSNGQRRAGMIISAEPGFNYSMRKTTIFLFVPVPIYRTTYQTVPDKQLNMPSRGGFANYSIFIGAVFKM